jgi:exodeoxyribonuclease VII large subunit
LVQAVAGYLGAVEQRHAAVVERATGRLAAAERALGDRAQRIARRTHASVERADERLGLRIHRLESAARRSLNDGERRLTLAGRRIAERAPHVLAGEELRLAALESRVRALDPINVLARGWSITRTADGRVIRDPSEVAPGEVITSQLAAGSLRSRVETDNEDPP